MRPLEQIEKLIAEAKKYEFASVCVNPTWVKTAADLLKDSSIIETCLLSYDEKVQACQLAKLAGADFVKTSTGFSTGGATIEDVELMREVVGPNMGVKAAGGTRSYKDAQAFIKAGANRIGTSAGVAIMEGESVDGGY